MSSKSIYTPYTYLIGWSKLDKWYYGRRTAKNCNPSDLWVKYFTSSKVVKAFRIINGEPDVIQIRRTFSNHIECAKWECEVLRRIDAQHHPKLLNLLNGDFKYDMTGVKFSDEHRAKMSDAAKGRIFSDETRENMSKAHKGKQCGSENPMYGSKRDDIAEWNIETKAKEYNLIGPDGTHYVGKNLNAFAKTVGIRTSSLHSVDTGRAHSSNGWTSGKPELIEHWIIELPARAIRESENKRLARYKTIESKKLLKG